MRHSHLREKISHAVELLIFPIGPQIVGAAFDVIREAATSPHVHELEDEDARERWAAARRLVGSSGDSTMRAANMSDDERRALRLAIWPLHLHLEELERERRT